MGRGCFHHGASASTIGGDLNRKGGLTMGGIASTVPHGLTALLLVCVPVCTWPQWVNLVRVLPLQIDLSSTTSVREFVEEFTRRKRKLNVLVNNAGMCPGFKDLTRRTTPEGFELTMATNHLGNASYCHCLLCPVHAIRARTFSRNFAYNWTLPLTVVCSSVCVCFLRGALRPVSRLRGCGRTPS